MYSKFISNTICTTDDAKDNRRASPGIISNTTTFHSLWICVAMLLHLVSPAQAVCTPQGPRGSFGYIGNAVSACLDESSDGNCPNFAAASNSVGCGNNNGVNGAMGDWNVRHVTDMGSLFYSKTSFNADLSRWDTSSVTRMDYSEN